MLQVRICVICYYIEVIDLCLIPPPPQLLPFVWWQPSAVVIAIAIAIVGDIWLITRLRRHLFIGYLLILVWWGIIVEAAMVLGFLLELPGLHRNMVWTTQTIATLQRQGCTQEAIDTVQEQSTLNIDHYFHGIQQGTQWVLFTYFVWIFAALGMMYGRRIWLARQGLPRQRWDG